MAKRSPILGYNHNVRYRGLVFHVQTEDSGLLNPHLFTHLFHEGVIVSTRKLVYDAGANEEAVKALMQAQHKAVMKDLRKGAFDEKIDQYLGGTPGLEPRTGAGAEASSSRMERAKTEADPTPIEIVNDGLSEPIELPVKQARTQSGDRTIPIEVPVSDVAAAVEAANSAGASPAKPRTQTAQKVSRTQGADVARAPTQLAQPPMTALDRDSAPVIEITVDDESDARRAPRDTAVELAEDRAARAGADSVPPTSSPNRHERPPSHGAATLPATKPPSRPIAPPVVTRPSTQDRKRPDSEVIEIYSPPPASAEPPPGERGERAGQYSMSRKDGAAIREQTGRIEAIKPATASPAQPPRKGSGSGPNVAPPPTPPTRQGAGLPRPPAPAKPGAQVPRPPTAPAGSRAPTPGRVHVTAPIASRAPSPASGGGVVMTRPAVIVGAPPKPPQPPQQRVRKAREEEGRGFGQGLISEKSLDEVILAYLSEDAEEK